MTEIATQNSWWSGTSWFAQGCSQDTCLQEAATLPTASRDSEAGVTDAKAKTQGVGGSVSQSRFLGKCHIPVYSSAPVEGAPAIKRSVTESQKRHHMNLEYNASQWKPEVSARSTYPGAAHTCDGSTANTDQPGPYSSHWVFNVDTWQWQYKGDVPPPALAVPRRAEHDIVARRWGDGRDTLAAALSASQLEHSAPSRGTEGPQQATSPKRQRLVVTAARGDAGPQALCGWAALGGLSHQKEQLGKAVLLPLRHPALFRHLGVEGVRGVLLYGAPGSGKTALARALAEEAGESVHFEALNGGECVGSDDATARMKRAFQTAARRAPSILFIDELDAVATARDGAANATSQHERQATSQLLCLIDGLRRSKAQVCLVAATNRRSCLDGALRRAGRLDMELSLGRLSTTDRMEVLRCASRAMPLRDDVDLARTAQRLRGYTAADCVAVCTEAALRCASEAVASLEEQGGERDHVGAQQFLSDLRVGPQHFEAALSTLGPAVLRGLCPELPDVRWEDVGGLQEAKAAVKDLVEFPLQHGSLLERMGMPACKGALLYGPPGCGKTLLAKAAASGCGANFVSVRGPELLQMWLGESERAVRELFETARSAAPCLVFFDELDSIAGRRGGAAGDAATARVLNQLLIEMDGMGDRGGVFVLAATNRPEALDPAILRPGRFGQLVKVSLPDEPSRLSILRSCLRRTPLHPQVDLPALAAATEGGSGADLAELCRRGGMAGIREWVCREEGGRGLVGGCGVESAAEEGDGCVRDVGADGTVMLTQGHLLDALGTLRWSVSAQAAQRYDDVEALLREGGCLMAAEEGMQEGGGGDEEAAGGSLQGDEGGVSSLEESNASGGKGAGAKERRGAFQQQQQLMQQLVRSTLDHSYASQVQQLQSRVEVLEGMLRAAGLEVPQGAQQAQRMETP